MNCEEVKRKIIDITKRQARSKTEVCIFEISKMDDLMTYDRAEAIRSEFVDNGTKVRQLSNYRRIGKWTDTEGFTDLMSIRYIDPEVLTIGDEIVVFDDMVAMYRLQPNAWYHEVRDESFAQTIRNLFNNVWVSSEVLVLGEDGSTYAKQYKAISMTVKLGAKSVPVVVYPAKDDGDITQAFDRMQKGCIEKYVQECLSLHATKLQDADMVIAYVWNDGKDRMCDLWSMQRNKLSDDSGFFMRRLRYGSLM